MLMRRRTLLIGASAGAGAAVLSLVGSRLVTRRDAVSPTDAVKTDPVKIGILSGGFREDAVEAFRQGLRANGWVLGENIVIIHKDVGVEIERHPAMVEELAAVGVRLIVTTGAQSTEAAMSADPSVPVVMAYAGNPITQGFVTNLAEPGGRVTGLGEAQELNPKRVELLKAIVPTAKRFAYITNSSIAIQSRIDVIQSAADAFGLQLRVFDVRTSAQLEPVFADVANWKAELLMTSGALANLPVEFVGLAARYRIPACYANLDWVRHGGLIGIGADVRAIHRRAADYVDKILRGAPPGKLPIEGPTGFEMLVNRKALTDIGLTLPTSVLLQVNDWAY
jgi:putative ABC transport system substrate-binding protein